MSLKSLKTKKRDILILIGLVIMVIIGGIVVQNTAYAHGNLEDKKAFVMGSLDVNDDQKEAVSEILDNHFAAVELIKESTKAQFETQFSTTRSELSGVLTEDQLEDLDDLHERIKAKIMLRHSGH